MGTGIIVPAITRPRLHPQTKRVEENEKWKTIVSNCNDPHFTAGNTRGSRECLEWDPWHRKELADVGIDINNLTQLKEGGNGRR